MVYRYDASLPRTKSEFNSRWPHRFILKEGGMKFFFLLSGVFILFLFAPRISDAQVPSAELFDVFPQTLRSGGDAIFQWKLRDAGGYSFVWSCTPGVKAKKRDGSAVACDTKISSVLTTADSLILVFSNVSGSGQQVKSRIIPKDASGKYVDAAGQDLFLTVATDPAPISSFTASATTTVPGQSVTLSWTSHDLEGVNMLFECRDEVKIAAADSAGFLSCETMVFGTDLAPSGSKVFNFTNASLFGIPLKITLLPAIVQKSYDGIHAAAMTITVASDTIPDPVIHLFTATSTTVESGKSLEFTWASEKTRAVNFKISCVNLITVMTVQDSSPLPCGEAFSFPKDFIPSGSAAFVFRNAHTASRAVTMTLVPSRKAGEYDATRAKTFVVTVFPEKATSTAAGIVLPAAPVSLPGAMTPPPAAAKKIVFTQLLKRNSRGTEVRALQEFLKRDPALYPEGLVTGFFGPATERAVQRFQKKYGIASGGAPTTTGYGILGPKTRAKLNGL